MYFVSLSVVTMLLATELFRRVSPYTPRDVVFVHPEGQAAAIPVRAFLMLVATVVAISLHTNWWRRSAVWAHLVGGILLICFVVDVAAYLAHESGLFAPPVVGQQLALPLSFMNDLLASRMRIGNSSSSSDGCMAPQMQDRARRVRR